jgi:hypothetical protein
MSAHPSRSAAASPCQRRRRWSTRSHPAEAAGMQVRSSPYPFLARRARVAQAARRRLSGAEIFQRHFVYEKRIRAGFNMSADRGRRDRAFGGIVFNVTRMVFAFSRADHVAQSVGPPATVLPSGMGGNSDVSGHSQRRIATKVIINSSVL